MGIFGRDDTPTDTPAGTTTRGAGPSAPIAAGDRTIITRPTTIDGKLMGSSEILIDGTVKGSVTCKSLVRVAERGSIEADVHAVTVQVAGMVNGDISADERIVLEKSARVKGNLTAPRILIQDGASFKGKVNMRPGEPRPAEQPTGRR